MDYRRCNIIYDMCIYMMSYTISQSMISEIETMISHDYDMDIIESMIS
jgi:hypothetical protein